MDNPYSRIFEGINDTAQVAVIAHDHMHAIYARTAGQSAQAEVDLLNAAADARRAYIATLRTVGDYAATMPRPPLGQHPSEWDDLTLCAGSLRVRQLRTKLPAVILDRCANTVMSEVPQMSQLLREYLRF